MKTFNQKVNEELDAPDNVIQTIVKIIANVL